MNAADKFTHAYVGSWMNDRDACVVRVPNEDGELEPCGWKADSIAHRTMSGSEFHPGDVIETRRALRMGYRIVASDISDIRRFTVVEVHGAAGFLVVVPEGQTSRRYLWTVETADARRPAPGELTEEYGR